MARYSGEPRFTAPSSCRSSIEGDPHEIRDVGSGSPG